MGNNITLQNWDIFFNADYSNASGEAENQTAISLHFSLHGVVTPFLLKREKVSSLVRNVTSKTYLLNLLISCDIATCSNCLWLFRGVHLTPAFEAILFVAFLSFLLSE